MSDTPNPEAPRVRTREEIEAEMQKIETRPVRIFRLDPGQFASLFTKGMRFYKNATVFEGLPEDAEIIGMQADPMRGGVMLVIKSSEYEQTPVTELPPVQPISIDLGKNISTKKKSTTRKK